MVAFSKTHDAETVGMSVFEEDKMGDAATHLRFRCDRGLLTEPACLSDSKKAQC